jgi:hypothetical protein
MVDIGHFVFLRMLTMVLKVSMHAELVLKKIGACSVCAKNPKFPIFLKTQKTTESTNF